MQISNHLFLPAFCISLFAPIAMAEGIAVPDKEQRQGMNYEEYSKYRENMRMQMEKIKHGNTGQKTDASSAQTEKSHADSTYGKGYSSRTSTIERPDSAAENRPERHRIERFNRGDMGRR